MIYYTLLPDKETRELKKEYKTRVFIALAFFVSCAVMVGIISFVPTYTISYLKQKEASTNAAILKAKEQDKQSALIISELATTTRIMKALKDDDVPINFSEIIPEILIHRSPQISVTSFKMNRISATSTISEVIIQGKAQNREALVSFEKELENDARMSKVELPVSNLAKSKDIIFGIKFNIKQ